MAYLMQRLEIQNNGIQAHAGVHGWVPFEKNKLFNLGAVVSSRLLGALSTPGRIYIS